MMKFFVNLLFLWWPRNEFVVNLKPSCQSKLGQRLQKNESMLGARKQKLVTKMFDGTKQIFVSQSAIVS